MRDPNHVTTHAEALAYYARQVEKDARIDTWNAEYDAKQREADAAKAAA